MFVYRAKEPPFLCFSMILNLSYCIRTGVVLFDRSTTVELK